MSIIKNFNLQLLCGGFYHCTQSWNKTVRGIDRCYKFYFPVGGSANVIIDDTDLTIKTGYCYFLSGFHIEKQYCKKDMDVYWVHFMPESLYLRYILSKIPQFHQWEISKVSFYKDIYTRLNLLFADPFAQINRPAFHPPMGLRSKMQSLLLYLTGDMLEGHNSSLMEKPDAELERLKPSIDYMDHHYIANPSLAEVAAQSHLAPNYFHRQFSKKFGMTPLNYMLRRRLEYAQRLLCTASLNVKEIAGICGYDNEFYFSRIFKKHLGTSPSDFRSKRWSI